MKRMIILKVLLKNIYIIIFRKSSSLEHIQDFLLELKIEQEFVNWE